MSRLIGVATGIVAVSVLAFAAGERPDGVYALQDPQTPPRQTELNVTLSNPGSHPRIGIQTFSIAGSSAALREAAETMADVLAADLEFEREFYVISRKASAGIPAAATPQSLPYSQWTDIGADFVLTGNVRDAGGKLDVEVRMMNIKSSPPGRQDFAQTYGGCTLANPRFCAHSIADDMHQKLRNLDGVARTRIVFSSDRDPESMVGRPIDGGGQGKEIYLMDYDGAQQRRVTANRSINIGGVWGPDGRTLAYATLASPYTDVYLTMLDGRSPTRPARGSDAITNHSPAISPDGTKIAYTSSRGGQTGYYDVWIVNRDGSNLRNLTPNTDRSTEGAPTWSPSGAQIAFTSDRTGTNHIYVVNADGTNLNRLTFEGKCDRPAWSRLNYIAYTLERPNGHDIAVTDLATRTARVLTDGLGSNRQPTVAPNGRHIAFITSRWGKAHVATIDIDGQYYRQLTTAGNNTFPNWSPTPGGR
jgi:TolB protein